MHPSIQNLKWEEIGGDSLMAVSVNKIKVCIGLTSTFTLETAEQLLLRTVK
jgi:hypothetical protein